MGKLAFFRVYSGTLKSGSYVLQLDEGTEASASAAWCSSTPTIARRSSRSAPATSPRSVGLKNTFTGDTLCDEAKPIVLEAITFPEPVIELAIEPKTKADQDKMGSRCSDSPRRTRPSGSAPTRRAARPDIAGMGELHLEVIVDRMMREFKVQANVGRPQVSYREAIRKAVRAEGRSCARPAARASTATSS